MGGSLTRRSYGPHDTQRRASVALSCSCIPRRCCRHPAASNSIKQHSCLHRPHHRTASSSIEQALCIINQQSCQHQTQHREKHRAGTKRHPTPSSTHVSASKTADLGTVWVRPVAKHANRRRKEAQGPSAPATSRHATLGFTDLHMSEPDSEREIC